MSALDDRPTLTSEELLYYNAFNFLSPMRHIGMGLSAISITDIISYYNVFCIFDSPNFFASVIREIDGIFLNEQQKQKKK